MEQKITALRIQKRNPNRVNVYLDDAFAFGLAKILAVGLRLGQTLTTEQIKTLQTKDAYEEALQSAFNFLSYRPRSEAEVVQHLQKRETPEETVQQVLDRLRALEFTNDQQFAQTWVNNRSEFRPRGARALRQELRQKGVAESHIQAALVDVDEGQLALEAARKKAVRYAGLDKPVFQKKMYGFLARRGFNHDAIQDAIRQVWSDIQTHRLQLIENEE